MTKGKRAEKTTEKTEEFMGEIREDLEVIRYSIGSLDKRYISLDDKYQSLDTRVAVLEERTANQATQAAIENLASLISQKSNVNHGNRAENKNEINVNTESSENKIDWIKLMKIIAYIVIIACSAYAGSYM